MRKTLLIVLLLSIAWLLIWSRAATAVEPICPGGSNPRADIVKCLGFDVSTGCTTGAEEVCWQNNGVPTTPNPTNSPYGFHIVQGSDAAVGAGYVRARPREGGTGAGAVGDYLNAAIDHFTSVTFRYYSRFSLGYVGFDSGHGPEIRAAGIFAGNPHFEIAAGKWQMSSFSNIIHFDGSGACANLSGIPTGLDSYGFSPNVAQVLLRNGRWYAIEVSITLDTACSNHGTLPWSGCNGSIQAWVDGVQTHNYTGLNLGKLQCEAVGFANYGFYAYQQPSMYFHKAFPPWRPITDYDNLVISKTGARIGCADTGANGGGAGACPGNLENARGTAIPQSPYGDQAPYVAHLGRHPAGDCTSGGFGGEYSAGGWGSALTTTSLDASTTHGLYTNQGCTTLLGDPNGMLAGEVHIPGGIVTVTNAVNASDCSVGGGSVTHNCRCTTVDPQFNNCTAYAATVATDNSLKVTVPNGDYSGIGFDPSSGYAGWPQQAAYGWVNVPALPSTSAAFAGWSWYSGPANGGTVSVGINGGNWGVYEKQFGGGGTHFVMPASPRAVTTGVWHEYELMVFTDGTVSLMIDRVRVLNRVALSFSPSWIFDQLGGTALSIIGVTDFVGSGTFTAYFDDQTLTTVSAWSCDGWGSDCPFGVAAPPPDAPTNLRFIP